MKDPNCLIITARKNVVYEIRISRVGTETPLVLDLTETEVEDLYQQLYKLLGKDLDKVEPLLPKTHGIPLI